MKPIDLDDILSLGIPHAERVVELLDFAQSLGVKIYVGTVTDADRTELLLSMWPLGSPPVWCSMREFVVLQTPSGPRVKMGKVGIILLDEEVLKIPGDLDEQGIHLISALAHEVAHTLVGGDEDLATMVERAIARTLRWPRGLVRNLKKYAPDEPDPADYRDAVRQGYLTRSGRSFDLGPLIWQSWIHLYGGRTI